MLCKDSRIIKLALVARSRPKFSLHDYVESKVSPNPLCLLKSRRLRSGIFLRDDGQQYVGLIFLPKV